MPKRYPNINYKFRPKSYWKDEDPEQAILKNIKGQYRKEQIKKALAQGNLKSLPEDILQETLSEESRCAYGRVHPSLMGGEYLPEYEKEEVEIARLSLNSTTSDVISIRAKKVDKNTIQYRVVDEYNLEFKLHFTTSKQPLSLARLIEFLEKSGHPELPGNLIVGYNNYNCSSYDPDYMPAAELRHFTKITSDFYPELEEHCEHVFDDWVKETEAEAGREEAEGE